VSAVSSYGSQSWRSCRCSWLSSWSVYSLKVVGGVGVLDGAVVLWIGVSQCWWSGDVSAGRWSSGNWKYVMVLGVGAVIVPGNLRCSRCCVGYWVHAYSWFDGLVYRHWVVVEW
jgi:hypothetical protein